MSENIAERLLYWVWNNTGNTPQDCREFCALVNDYDGWHIREWKYPEPSPNIATLEALDGPTVDAWYAATLEKPTPSVTVPMVDSNLVAVGTARLLVDAETMETIIVTNSHSPERVWAEQRADALAARATQDTLRADCKALKTEISTNKDQTQAVVTTGETQAVKDLRKELIDAHVEIEHLRDIVRKLVKASQ